MQLSAGYFGKISDRFLEHDREFYDHNENEGVFNSSQNIIPKIKKNRSNMFNNVAKPGSFMHGYLTASGVDKRKPLICIGFIVSTIGVVLQFLISFSVFRINGEKTKIMDHHEEKIMLENKTSLAILIPTFLSYAVALLLLSAGYAMTSSASAGIIADVAKTDVDKARTGAVNSGMHCLGLILGILVAGCSSFLHKEVYYLYVLMVPVNCVCYFMGVKASAWAVWKNSSSGFSTNSIIKTSNADAGRESLESGSNNSGDNNIEHSPFSKEYSEEFMQRATANDGEHNATNDDAGNDEKKEKKSCGAVLEKTDADDGDLIKSVGQKNTILTDGEHSKAPTNLTLPIRDERSITRQLVASSPTMKNKNRSADNDSTGSTGGSGAIGLTGTSGAKTTLQKSQNSAHKLGSAPQIKTKSDSAWIVNSLSGEIVEARESAYYVMTTGGAIFDASGRRQLSGSGTGLGPNRQSSEEPGARRKNNGTNKKSNKKKSSHNYIFFHVLSFFSAVSGATAAALEAKSQWEVALICAVFVPIWGIGYYILCLVLEASDFEKLKKRSEQVYSSSGSGGSKKTQKRSAIKSGETNKEAAIIVSGNSGTDMYYADEKPLGPARSGTGGSTHYFLQEGKSHRAEPSFSNSDLATSIRVNSGATVISAASGHSDLNLGQLNSENLANVRATESGLGSIQSRIPTAAFENLKKKKTFLFKYLYPKAFQHDPIYFMFYQQLACSVAASRSFFDTFLIRDMYGIESVEAQRYIYGLIVLFSGISGLVTAPIAGYLCHGMIWKRRLIYISVVLNLINALLMIFFPIKNWSYPTTPLIIAGMIFGVGNSSHLVSSTSLILDCFDNSEHATIGRAEIVGVWQSAVAFGLVFGSFFSGVVLDVFSMDSFFGMFDRYLTEKLSVDIDYHNLHGVSEEVEAKWMKWNNYYDKKVGIKMEADINRPKIDLKDETHYTFFAYFMLNILVAGFGYCVSALTVRYVRPRGKSYFS